MIERAQVAGYDYWAAMAEETRGEFYVLAYLNDVDDCRTTFFPYATTCRIEHDATQAGMFGAFDEIEAALPGTTGGIHYYSNAFASNLPGWPKLAGKLPVDE